MKGAGECGTEEGPLSSGSVSPESGVKSCWSGESGIFRRSNRS